LEPERPWSIGNDVARVRAKTAPGSLSRAALERLATIEVPVLLDFNCSANEDAEVIEQVLRASEFATIDAVEQPYAPGNVIDHARLAEQLSVPLSLDEGVRNERDLDQIVRYSAASLVCVKPARVGGLANARTMFQRAATLGLRPYLGGFFESPYARRVHRLLAECCVLEPSDVGPVETLDPTESELERHEHGVGVSPSRVVLERAALITSWPDLPF
jgi:o-succinylbenzoate synthase